MRSRALGVSRANVWGVQHFEHRRSHDPQQQRRGHEPERMGREDHLDEIARRAFEERPIAARGQQAPSEREDQDQQSRQPEIRNRPENGGERADGDVSGPAVSKRRDRAERQRDQVCDRKGKKREFERHGKASQDVGRGGDAILEGRTEIPAQRVAQPVRVLQDERPVEAVQRLEAHDRLRRRVDAERRSRRGSRHHVDGDEQDHRRREKRRNEQRKSREDKPQHMCQVFQGDRERCARSAEAVGRVTPSGSRRPPQRALMPSR